jgi:hypothetical protein
VQLAGLHAPLAIDKIPHCLAAPEGEPFWSRLQLHRRCSSQGEDPQETLAGCIIRLYEARDDNSLAEKNKKALRSIVNRTGAAF